MANALRHTKPVRCRRARNRPGTPQPWPTPAAPRTRQTRTQAAQVDGTGARTASPRRHQRSISAASPTDGDPRATASAHRDRTVSPAGGRSGDGPSGALIPASAPDGFRPVRPVVDCLAHSRPASTPVCSNRLTARETRPCPGWRLPWHLGPAAVPPRTVTRASKSWSGAVNALGGGVPPGCRTGGRTGRAVRPAAALSRMPGRSVAGATPGASCRGRHSARRVTATALPIRTRTSSSPGTPLRSPYSSARSSPM